MKKVSLEDLQLLVNKISVLQKKLNKQMKGVKK